MKLKNINQNKWFIAKFRSLLIKASLSDFYSSVAPPNFCRLLFRISDCVLSGKRYVSQIDAMLTIQRGKKKTFIQAYISFKWNKINIVHVQSAICINLFRYSPTENMWFLFGFWALCVATECNIVDKRALIHSIASVFRDTIFFVSFFAGVCYHWLIRTQRTSNGRCRKMIFTEEKKKKLRLKWNVSLQNLSVAETATTTT